MRTIYVSVCVALALASFVKAQTGITAPLAHFGFELTADGKYAMWDQEVAYYEKLAQESDRIDLQVVGRSTLGRPFILLTISSPQNLAKADRYKEISRQIADPRGLTPQQIDALSAEGRAMNGSTFENSSSNTSYRPCWRTRASASLIAIRVSQVENRADPLNCPRCVKAFT